LTSSRIIPPYRRIGRRLWTWRRPLAVGVLLALSLSLARLIYGPLDRNPVTVTWEGKHLVLENEHGQIIDRIDAGEATVRHATDRSRGYSTRDATLADVDGDGTNEGIWTRIPGDRTGDRSEVICSSTDSRGVRWRVDIGARFHFPQNPSADSTMYRVTHLSAGDFDRDGSVEIFLSANGGSFTAILLKLDGKTGARRDLYLHVGHLYAMEPFDIDGDGRDEIIFTGINNALEEACIGVLPATRIGGCGPTKPPYVPIDIAPAEHRTYLLVPRTVVGDAFRYLQRSNKGIGLSPYVEGGRGVLVGIDDVMGLQPSYFEVTSARYYVTFDSRMVPVSVNTGDDYDLLSKKLFETGKIPFLPQHKPEYWGRYLKTIQCPGD
jgi:hypothetical protein